MKSYISKIVENHRRDWNPDEPRDFIDAFLTEMTKVGKTMPVFSYRKGGVE